MVASLLQVQRQSPWDERHWQLEWNLDFERAVLSALRVWVQKLLGRPEAIRSQASDHIDI